MGFFLRLEEYIEDYAAGDPKDLIVLFRSVLERVALVIESSNNPRELNLIGLALIDLSTYALTSLDHAHSAQTPRGLVQMLRAIRDKLYAGSLLIVSPKTEHNYTITNIYPEVYKHTKRLLSNSIAKEILSNCEAGINVVGFPRIERENILLHVLFGHEFGHPVADEFIAAEAKSKKSKADLASIRKQVNSVVRTYKINDNLDRTEAHKNLFVRVIEIRTRGLQELVSDAVATFIFGPSAIFAAADVLIPDGLDNVPTGPEYYPPTRFRIRLMMKVLAETEYLRVLREITLPRYLIPIRQAVNRHMKLLSEIAKGSDDLKAISNLDEHRIAFNWLQRSLTGAIAHAKRRVEKSTYSSKIARLEVPQCLERLYLEVPPGEIGKFPHLKAVDCRSAILAGWMYKIYQVTRKDADWITRAKQISMAQSLTLKGIEDSFLKGEYDEKYPRTTIKL